MSQGRLTDLELSGAPALLTREADRARPTRPLERLVSRHAQNAESGDKASPIRHRTSERSTRTSRSRSC